MDLTGRGPANPLPKGLVQARAPGIEARLGLGQQVVDQHGKRLREAGIRDVAAELVELALEQRAAAGRQGPLQLPDQRRLAHA